MDLNLAAPSLSVSLRELLLHVPICFRVQAVMGRA